MNAVQELDDSRSEATVEQARDAVQGSPRSSTLPPLAPSRSDESTEERRGSTQGSSVTTVRPRLDTQSAFAFDFADSGLEQATNVVSLQPVDQGLGAWSYVAGAFSMYIVVWGK